VWNVINKTLELELELEHEALRALKELRKEVESLKSNAMVYKPSSVLWKKVLTYMRALLIHASSNGTRSGCAQAHMPVELIIYNITDRKERVQWKALKGRSRQRYHCSRAITIQWR